MGTEGAWDLTGKYGDIFRGFNGIELANVVIFFGIYWNSWISWDIKTDLYCVTESLYMGIFLCLFFFNGDMQPQFLMHMDISYWYVSCRISLIGFTKINIGGSFWHAADTAPLEGLSILRCAIYDPVEGLQISKMRFSEMGV